MIGTYFEGYAMKIFLTAIYILTLCVFSFSQDIDTDPRKIAIVNSNHFLDEKYGIPLLVEAFKREDERKWEEEKLKILLAEIDVLKKNLSGLEGSSTLFSYKLDVLLSTQREYLHRSKSLAYYPRRKKEELMRRLRIYDALQEFRKRRDT